MDNALLQDQQFWIVKGKNVTKFDEKGYEMSMM